MKRCDAYFKFGFSGTAMTKDKIRNLTLIGLTGRVLSEVKAMDLVDEGILANPEIKFISYSSKDIVDAYTYGEVYEEGIVYNDSRNKQILDLVKKHNGQPMLILIQRIKHGDIVKNMLIAESIDCEFMSGKEDKDLRESVLARFKAGELKTLIGSTIYDLGVDLPTLSVLILAGGGKSDVAILQRIGRSLRKSEGKDTTMIYDFSDVSHSFLKKHTKSRYKLYKENRFPVKDVEGELVLI